MTSDPEILSVLKSRFGFDRFLPLQEEIVTNVIAGNDSLVLMPTGAGKSLCYQLPALCMDGYTMVVSPLSRRPSLRLTDTVVSGPRSSRAARSGSTRTRTRSATWRTRPSAIASGRNTDMSVRL